MSCAKLEKFQTTEILTAVRGLSFKGRTDLFLCSYSALWGHAAGGAVGLGTVIQVGRSRVRFPTVSLEFFIDIILPAALWSWGRL